MAYRPRLILTVFGVASILAERSVHAYGDPGSGTLIWQMALAIIVGISFYARRILLWFRVKIGKSDTSAGESAQSSPIED